MTTLVQIILIATIACLVDGRLRTVHRQRILNNNSDQNMNPDQFHEKAEIKSNLEANQNHVVVKHDKAVQDADIIIFPSDVDTKIYPDMNKIVTKDENVMHIDKLNSDADSEVNKDIVDVPLISKVVPAVEPKEVFTNPIPLDGTEDVTFKVIEDTEQPTTLKSVDEAVDTSAVAIDTNVTTSSSNITLDDIKEIQVMSNDTSGSNDTVPDFSNRFGATSNYMLVPVNNVQTYQPMPVIQNLPVSNVQGIPLVANIDANSQYATPNVASNIGTNPQYMTSTNNDQGSAYPLVANDANTQYAPNIASNIGTNPYMAANVQPNGLNLYASPVNTLGPPMNGVQGNNNIPINVPNTYMINGQLYAAVTVPNNVNVPNSLYFVNPQASAYQVANNLPLYKLVSVGSQVGGQVGGQVGQANVNNAQYVLQ